jgi:translation initiation factor IF-2
VFTGDIASLRRFEDDVREVQAGRECGLRIRDFNDIQIGDRLEFFVIEEVER